MGHRESTEPRVTLKRRFALIKWARLEAWLVVKALLVLSLALLRTLRVLSAVGILSDASINRGIAQSEQMSRRAHKVWDDFIAKRDRLKADAENHLRIRSQQPRRRL